MIGHRHGDRNIDAHHADLDAVCEVARRIAVAGEDLGAVGIFVAVNEINGDIMVWFHPEGAPPAWEVPEVPELNDENWSTPQYWEFTVPNHVQNIAENTCDPEHFQYVHHNPETPYNEITIAEDGRVLTLYTKSEKINPPQELWARMHNPGLAIVRTRYAENAEMLVYSTAQPTTLNETHLRWTLAVRKEIVDFAGDEVMRAIKDGIFDDMPIWQHKVYRDKPVFCKADTGLIGFRKWVKQFYVEDADRSVAKAIPLRQAQANPID